MKKAQALVLIALLVALAVGGCQQAVETPSAREWAFNPQKVWEMQQVGEDRLLRPAEPRLADDGTLYFHDFERHLSYIVDPDGLPVSTFAGRGSGEGEVPMYLNCFSAGDYVVICTMDGLHFFTNQGQFVKAVPNNPFIHFPLAFKNEDEFWVGPGALGDAPGEVAKVTFIDLASGDETTVHEFTRSEVESKPTGGGVVIGLTPQLKMGYDRSSGLIYFGKNSDTVIYRLAVNGDQVDSFSFTGTRHPVSEADKRSHFAQFNIPEEAVTSLIRALPDQMAYYHRIQVIDGLVYLFSTEGIGHALSGQRVDIYSLDGRHLYYGEVGVEDGWHVSNPDNLQMTRGFIYAVQANDAGEKKIVKYRVDLPES